MSSYSPKKWVEEYARSMVASGSPPPPWGQESEGAARQRAYEDLSNRLVQARVADDSAEQSALIQHLVTQTIPLIEALAHGFKARGSLTVQDLIQEGALESAKQAQHFDPSKGPRFDFFAFPRIKGAMARAIRRQGVDVHISDHAATRSGTYSDRERPSVVVVSVESGASWNTDETGIPAGVQLEDECPLTPEEAYAAEEQSIALRRAVARLPSEMREVVRSVYGLGCPVESIREIALKNHCSRRRVDTLLEEAREILREELGEALGT